jgi:cytochrome P450
VCELGAGPLRMVVVADPSMLSELFALSPDHFRWRHKFNWFASVVGEGSMLTNDEPEHKRLRSAVQAGFSRRRLNAWIPMIVDRTDRAIDDLLARTHPGEVVDLYPIGRDLTLQVVTHALFGERLAVRADEIGALMQNAQDYMSNMTPPHPFPFGRQARVRADRRALDVIIDTEIAHHRSHPSGDALNVLEALVVAGELSDSEIRDQVVTLIAAGFDTTAASLAWMLWCATVSDDLWYRLGAEAESVLGPPGSERVPSDHESLRALELADRVTRETLRLHPAGALNPRVAATDIDAGGYHVPSGTMVVWSAHLVGRDPDAWPDPLRFDPDRHLDPTAEQAALAKAAWVPFGSGARNCIGFALAQMELTLISARLAQRLTLIPQSATIPEPTGRVVNRPEGGVPMQVQPRTR